jgi:SAM-dependent methyltransferase
MPNAGRPVDSYEYVGSELTRFKHVRNWKRYFRSQLAPYVRGDVLEVGAGIGSTTLAVFTPACTSWTCLEPDPALAAELGESVSDLRDVRGCAPRIQIGFVAGLEPSLHYDSILYIDTLEHVDRDAEELAAAARHLRPGGTIAVLAPAHQWLYTPFDRSIGHYRRYSIESLRASAPPGLQLVRARYLDVIGVIALLANRVCMRSAMPSAAQLAVWDTWFVPVSRALDPVCAYRIGKSVLCVWRLAG